MGSDYSARRSDERIGPLGLEGFLSIPDHAHGIVIFAHGSGSSRHSSRNTHVAAALHEKRLATLLFDLLTSDEAHNRKNVFDIELLSERVLDAVQWAAREPRTERFPIGLFGASTWDQLSTRQDVPPHYSPRSRHDFRQGSTRMIATSATQTRSRPSKITSKVVR